MWSAQATPRLSIQTIDSKPIKSKEVWVEAQMELEGQSLLAVVKGRGNSTWEMPKKPYRLKLKSASSLMGMPPAKEWVLLANYSDKTLMRNYVALNLGQQLKFLWTPKARVVEVAINGSEKGTYLLAENIEVSEQRLRIDRTEGFLLELDQRRDGEVVFVTSRKVPYVLKAPSSATPARISEIKAHMQQIENVLYSKGFADPDRGYLKYLDLDSFVDFYLVNELLKNQDAAAFSSIYLYKDKNQKLAMGPLWDFDLSAGNVNYSDAEFPTGWWLRTHSPWFARLFEDPVFLNRVKMRWWEIRTQKIEQIFPFIDQTAEYLAETQKKNFTIWDILNTYVWPNAVVTGSYAGEVEYYKGWLRSRVEWMDQELKF